MFFLFLHLLNNFYYHLLMSSIKLISSELIQMMMTSTRKLKHKKPLISHILSYVKKNLNNKHNSIYIVKIQNDGFGFLCC